MTRINNIPVCTLTDQHLVAEYRELPMVHGSLKRTLASKRGLVRSNIPSSYTLNKGHVTFHYDKGLYLFNRYQQLIAELRVRGYNVKPEDRSVDWEIFKKNSGLWNDWSPTSVDLQINTQRIVERIRAKPAWYRYYRQTISPSFLDERYKPFM
jgi:deoxyribonuclease (pyrimidine dimer)